MPSLGRLERGIALNSERRKKERVRRVISIFLTFQVFVRECIGHGGLSGKIRRKGRKKKETTSEKACKR